MDWLKRCVNLTSHVPVEGMWEVGRERRVSPRGMGSVGVYWLGVWARSGRARRTRMTNVECRMTNEECGRTFFIRHSGFLIIRHSPSNPVSHQLGLRVTEQERRSSKVECRMTNE